MVEPDNMMWTKLPRNLENGDIVLPCSISYVFKLMSGFSYESQTVNVSLTAVLRIRLTGYEDDEGLTNKIENDLKVRINESEFKVMDDLNARVSRISSSSAVEGKKDMFSFTMRLD